MSRSLLPEFIIIGAAKAATTWIAHQLRSHPGAFLPAPEPHFFSTEFDRGLDWYRQCFRDAHPGEKIGEKSADYLAHPLAARRIAEMLPDARLVVQLRNPIERAYSDFCMLYRRGTVRGDPRPYFQRATTPQPRFLDDGLYHRHLDRFLEFFPREQIKIFLYEDIKERPAEVVAQVCNHIGIEPPTAPAALRKRVNDSEAALLPLGLRLALRPLKPIVKPLRNHDWFRRMRQPLARQVQYPPLEPDLRLRLRDFYADDVARLEPLLERDLSPWLADEQAA